MIAEPDQREQHLPAAAGAIAAAALDAFAAAARRLADCPTLSGALTEITEATAQAVDAEVALARVLEPAGECMITAAVAARSPAVAAELGGTRVPILAVALDEVDDRARMPEAARRAAALVGAGAVLQIPVLLGGHPVATLELMRTRRAFDRNERAVARLAAAQIGFAVRAFGTKGAPTLDFPADGSVLHVVGEALAAGSDDERTEEDVARLATGATGAIASLIWLNREDDVSPPLLAASYGVRLDASTRASLGELVSRALMDTRGTVAEEDSDGPSGEPVRVATIRLGQPAIGALQLLFDVDDASASGDPAALATFGARAAHALRSSEKSRRTTDELERARALLAVIAQAIAQLSLAHTLETAVERVAELLAVERVAIYLHEARELQTAAARGIEGPHLEVAECLLELALGPFRGRGMVLVEDALNEPRLANVRDSVKKAGIEAALGVPLVARDDVIGLLAVYPRRRRGLTANESALVRALAAQLAVAVENARLHEQAKQLGSELEQALASERQAARQLGTLYEISRSFAQSLSLEATLEAVARSVVESFDLDAAVIRMRDERGESLVTRAIHVADPRLHEPVRAILSRSQPMSAPPVQRLLETAQPLLLDPERAGELDTSHNLLAPFLEQGSTAGIIPIATSAEVLATLTLLSLDPSRRITTETVGSALSVARQAALAIDNARLYHQQKDFADTMQRSLLPRSRPRLEGLELGDVYESSARVDVGGDVYDYMVLPDGRLAVVLGDVTGHGIEATADMAMAKFVFRSLVREHPDASNFLASANEVVLGEVPVGKFVTMVYMTIDGTSGEVACSCAGHPPPRLVRPDGSVAALGHGGLPLGIESEQTYPQDRAVLSPHSSIVLYTDGLIEARRDGELYGVERLDQLLEAKWDLPAPELARAVVDDCRTFSGGDLTDDCAVVVIKRL
ncbi:MAG: SpoIIE family protein phosphatase [Actinobacteria bacterium]|nr:SpoIIE family protein phosphatase [Actinomycetota bacterium]